MLLRWSEGNAAAMIVFALAAVAGLPAWLLSVCGAVSFSMLIYRCRGQWTPRGQFGGANVVSSLRLAGMVVLPWLAPVQIACLGVILFALDGVDGWIARRAGLAGEFGEFIDKESDAFFILMLCLLLYRLPDNYGPWILLPGLLRYLFVLFVRFARPPQAKERRTAKGRWIAFFVTLTLLLAFAAHPDYVDYARPLAVLMTIVLVYSFAESVYLMYGAQRRRERT